MSSSWRRTVAPSCVPPTWRSASACPLEAEIEREGVAVLPARLLLDVARALPSGAATLELRPSEGDVEVVSGSATFHIRTLRAEDFPPFPEPGGDQIVRVPDEGVRGDRGQGRAVGVA